MAGAEAGPRRGGLKGGTTGAEPTLAAGGVRSSGSPRGAQAAELELEPEREPAAESEPGARPERAPSTWGPQIPS